MTASRMKSYGALNTAVGAEVRRLRLAAGMSQVALAKAVGMKQGNLSRREAGKLPWEVGVMLPRVAIALGTTGSAIVMAAEKA